MSSGGWILSILVIILIAAAIAWLARELSATPDRGVAAEMSPREILDRRLASGEINTEQYDELRQTLRSAARTTDRARDRRPPVPRAGPRLP